MAARKFQLHYLAILLLVTAICTPCVAAAQVVGSVTKVQKQAQIGSTTAVVGTPVKMNDEIRTGPGARLQITLRDETLFTLGENARMVVDRYVFDPDSSTGVMALKASQGALRFATGKLSNMRNKDLTVTTPHAALAVRGTEFWAGFVPGYYTYGVLLLSETGKVDVSNSGKSVTLSAPGQGTDIPPCLKAECGPTPPEFWSAEKKAAALSTTDFGYALLGPELLAPGFILIPLGLRNEDNGVSP
jgi:hypothetical protein